MNKLKSVSQSKFVYVDLRVQPIPKAIDGFVHMLLVGVSPNLPVGNALRLYNSIEHVAEDFGAPDPEYQAANIYFQQENNNGNLYVGRWFKEDAAGDVLGIGYEGDITRWNAITDGSCIFNTPTAIPLSGLDFSTVISLYDVASVVQTAIEASSATDKPTITFDGREFRLTLATTTEQPYFLTPNASGTDISGLLGLSSDKKPILSKPVQAEDINDCLLRLQKLSNDWSDFSLAAAFGAENDPSIPSDVALKASAFANGRKAIYWLTIFGSSALNTLDNSSIAYQIEKLKHDSTAIFYGDLDASIPNIYTDVACASIACSVDYTQYNTYLTLAYKSPIGVFPVNVEDRDFEALKSKNVNAYINSGGRTWIQTGSMSDGHFIDQIQGLIYFRKAITNDLFNALETSLSIPQTESGMTKAISVINDSCQRMVKSGFLAPNVWRENGVGKIKTGDTLTEGYYIYSDPIALQSDADRQARRAPTIYVLATGAGALQYFVPIVLEYQA